MISNILSPKLFNYKMLPVRLSTSQKIVALSVTASVVLLGVLARFLRRRKTPRPLRRVQRRGGRRTRNSVRSPNDLISVAGSKISARSGSPVASIIALSDRMSLASGSVGPNVIVTPHLTSQQLGVMGMEALEAVINHWEDALAVHYSPGGVPAALTTAEESEFCREIQNLLDMAYTLQEQSELLFLDQRSVLFREETQLEKETDKVPSRLRRTGSDPNFDSAESFASALDQVADLREFEDFTEAFAEFEQYPLYTNAVKQFEDNPIPCRTLRTEMVGCSTDLEYLAKLHCIRLAFQFLFKDQANGQWVADTGRQVLTDLLCLGDKDPKDFLVGYEDLMQFLHDQNNWSIIESELDARDVKAMTFYDICIDFIILDSFRDLENPPGSVMAVVQNRFLSNGFKETALTTAVWSVLKAKKRLLKYPNGFMSHFYTISEQISPLMAWGFFGPNENLRDICHYFREQTLGFLVDIFNFQKCRYTTVEDLSEDILQHMKTRVNNIGVKFSQ
ncbi:mitoguardin [Condylostylus longicornis]|uniref:mitoguardin n=1 Tax=Condylostylus longicornis TaxID=2530218 RepID=UPI00244E3559|nr:mitoguardin [Condylostylus longicornis]XP_055380836.1 mitoguardin [Condylostylus longicornis]